MHPDELKSLFDQQAAGYDRQWEKTAPIRQCLQLLLEPLLAGLPEQAHVLCVGVGTGVEMAHLARRFPGWRFTALDPSGAMLEVSRQRAQAEGFAARCRFHEGYVEDLPAEAVFDAATCFLVSQFILDVDARVAFFRRKRGQVHFLGEGGRGGRSSARTFRRRRQNPVPRTLGNEPDPVPPPVPPRLGAALHNAGGSKPARKALPYAA